MPEGKIRVLLGKPGEGHKEASIALDRSFSEAGFDAIDTEPEKPEAIIRSSMQESADQIGITTLRGLIPRHSIKCRESLRSRAAIIVPLQPEGPWMSPTSIL